MPTGLGLFSGRTTWDVIRPSLWFATPPCSSFMRLCNQCSYKKQAHSGFRKYLSAQLPGSLSFSLPSERWLPLPWKLITFSWWCYFSSSPRWSQVSFGNLLMALTGTGDTGAKGEQVMATSWFCKSTNKESILNGLWLTAGLQQNEPGRD